MSTFLALRSSKSLSISLKSIRSARARSVDRTARIEKRSSCTHLWHEISQVSTETHTKILRATVTFGFAWQSTVPMQAHRQAQCQVVRRLDVGVSDPIPKLRAVSNEAAYTNFKPQLVAIRHSLHPACKPGIQFARHLSRHSEGPSTYSAAESIRPCHSQTDNLAHWHIWNRFESQLRQSPLPVCAYLCVQLFNSNTIIFFIYRPSAAPRQVPRTWRLLAY